MNDYLYLNNGLFSYVIERMIETRRKDLSFCSKSRAEVLMEIYNGLNGTKDSPFDQEFDKDGNEIKTTIKTDPNMFQKEHGKPIDDLISEIDLLKLVRYQIGHEEMIFKNRELQDGEGI